MTVAYSAHGGFGLPINSLELPQSAPKALQKLIWKRMPNSTRELFSSRKEFFSEEYFEEEGFQAAFPEFEFVFTRNPFYAIPTSQRTEPHWLAVLKRSYQRQTEEGISKPRLEATLELTHAEEEAFEILKRFAKPEDSIPAWRVALTVG